MFPSFLGKKTFYSTLKVWIFSGETKGYGDPRQSDLLMKDMKEKYFSELPGNIEEVKFSKLGGNSYVHLKIRKKNPDFFLNFFLDFFWIFFHFYYMKKSGFFFGYFCPKKNPDFFM